MMDEIPHIIHRPDTYIGSVQEEEIKQWIFSTKDDVLIQQEKMKFIQGLYKIFDEIAVNAYDHTQEDPSCTKIKFWIDKKAGTIKVWNNGKGIPITKDPKHKIYYPTMLFGHLRSSSNYDDSKKRTTGGRNGLGGKLANIFSTEFVIETVDAKRQKKLKQTWTDNMQKTDGPEITDCGDESFTSFTFTPDTKIFKTKGFSDDMYNLMKKRVYDITMVTSDKVKVYFNDKQIKEKSFLQYIKCYFPNNEYEAVVDDKQKRWKVAMVYDRESVMDHKHISFVNGVCTSRGGKHLNHVVDQIVDKVMEKVKRTVKSSSLTTDIIKKSMIFFINCQIENPRFDTQTKECMTLKESDFGSEFKVTKPFIQKIVDSGIVEDIIERLKNAETMLLGKMTGGNKGGRISGIPKLDDAHKAGTKESLDCALILTEGDSAKALATAGRSALKRGTDYYGIFPLKGKLLNVRKANTKKTADNEEISALMKILRLNPKADYKKSLDGLRYGHILVMADQDLDGFHIKGLIMNFLDHFFPDILKYHPGFIQSLVTPIVKCTKGKDVMQFYNLNEYNEWLENNQGWKTKYYKGLGTSDSTEAREYFRDIDQNLISYFDAERKKGDKSKVTTTREAMDLAFRDDKKKKGDEKDSDLRKLWLKKYDDKLYIERSQKEVSCSDFINVELIQFSHASNIRAIPNLMDSLKPGQRKIIYSAFKRNLNDEIKVSQFAGYVSEHSAYHHGEKSLLDTMVGMAQNYVGSNNMPLMVPKGMFGTRLIGGEDSASARYIFTHLNHLDRLIYSKLDEPILTYVTDDGVQVEPKFYPALLPLLNHDKGVGTGYSTDIPPANPKETMVNLRRIIKGKEQFEMLPWYRHFTGTIEKIDKYTYLCKGKYEIIGENMIKVTELPVKEWTLDFKAHLENLMNPEGEKITGKSLLEKDNKKKKGAKNAKGKRAGKSVKPTKATKGKKVEKAKPSKVIPIIKNYKSDSSDVKIDFTITFKDGYLKNASQDQIEDLLGLKKQIKTSNMHMFNENYEITKYKSFNHILKDFAKVRLKYYQMRKDYLLKKYGKEKKLLSWKMKFVEYVLDGKIIIYEGRKGKTRTIEDVHQQLKDHEFPMLVDKTRKDTGEDNNKPSYNYTKIGLYQLTRKEVERLRKLLDDKVAEIKLLESKSNSDLWLDELQIFEDEYDKWSVVQDKIHEKLMKTGQAELKKRKRSKSGKKDD